MPCNNRDNLIYNVKELPEIFSVAAGDLLLIETENGTNILDFESFVIGLDNTTFGSTISANTTNIATLSSNFDTLSSSVTTSVNELSSSIVTSNTKALISLTSWGGDIVIHKSANIASAEIIGSVIRFNFSSNFDTSNYLVLPSANVVNGSDELATVVLASRSTNYLDLSVLDTADMSRATSAADIGFKLESF